MNCQEIKALIPLYIDEGLNTEQMQQVSEHLEVCIPCRNIYEEYLAMRNMLLDVREVDLPVHFGGFSVDELKDTIDADKEEVNSSETAEKRKKSFSDFKWKRWTAVAAVFVIGLFSYAMIQDSKTFLNEKMSAPQDLDDTLTYDSGDSAITIPDIDDKEATDQTKSSNKTSADIQTKENGQQEDMAATLPKNAFSVPEPQSPQTEDTGANAGIKLETAEQDSAAEESNSLSSGSGGGGGAAEPFLASPMTVPENTDIVEEATEDSAGSCQSTSAPYNGSSGDYALIAETLSGYEYEITKENPVASKRGAGEAVKTEYTILVKKDKQGNTLNKEMVLSVENGVVTIITDIKK